MGNEEFLERAGRETFLSCILSLITVLGAGIYHTMNTIYRHLSNLKMFAMDMKQNQINHAKNESRKLFLRGTQSYRVVEYLQLLVTWTETGFSSTHQGRPWKT